MGMVRETAALQNQKRPPRVVLWGLGRVFQRRLPHVVRLRDAGQIELVAATASVPPAVPLPAGIAFTAPDALPYDDIDFVLITNTNNEQEIIAYATGELGLARTKLLPHRALDLPGFDATRYSELCQRGLRIASNGAFGDVVARMLGLKNQTPFVGTQLKEADYLRLVARLPHYLSLECPVYRGVRVGWDARPYHSFLFDDVEVRMCADVSREEALLRWRQACAACDPQRTLFEFHTTDRGAEEVFEHFEHLPHRVCLVPYRSDLAHTRTVALQPGQTSFAQAVTTFPWAFEDASFPIDLLGLLLGASDESEEVPSG